MKFLEKIFNPFGATWEEDEKRPSFSAPGLVVTSDIPMFVRVKSELTGEIATRTFDLQYAALLQQNGKWNVTLPDHVRDPETREQFSLQSSNRLLTGADEKEAFAFIATQEYLHAREKGQTDFAAYIRKRAPRAEAAHIARILDQMDKAGQFALDRFRPVSPARKLARLRHAPGRGRKR